MEKTGFIYLWYDRKNRRYYLGSHLGAEDDGYVCSSKWMRQSFKRRPEDFKRRILQRNLSKQVLKEEEHKWLKLIKRDELGVRYYNLNNIYTPGLWEKGKARPEETKRKVSEGLKRTYQNGYTPWNKGKKQTEEVKQKVSEGLKKAWKEGRFTVNKSHFKKGQTPWNVGEVGTKHMKKVWKNPEFKKQQIEKKKQMWASGEYQGNKGKSWFTNGINNIMLSITDIVPEGFYKGRVFHG